MTANTTVAVAVPEPERVRAHLDAVAARLGRNGWYARVTTLPGGTLALHVINPANLAGKRLVLIEDQAQGPWFRFHHGAFIAPVGEPDQAAARIARLMAAPHC
ncbi:MAG TPA: hypothetical protein VFU43_01135 [Streptosporangiaceae bacterium]|nr:hypothetical protein [Streptosporangiaceae bacterium]